MIRKMSSIRRIELRVGVSNVRGSGIQPIVVSVTVMSILRLVSERHIFLIH